MRKLVLLGAMLATVPARAADRGPYLGAAGAAFIGGGFEGLEIPALGVEVTTGYRLSARFSIEGIFTGQFHTERWREPGGGQVCSGNYTEQWHWQTLGARVWFRAKESPHLDVSVAPPWLAGGVAYEHGRELYPTTGFCAQFDKPRDRGGPMIVFGLIAVAVDLKLGARFAFRLTTGTEIDLAQDTGIGVLALTASLGPVVRF